MNSSQVTVCIPTYNGRRYLEKSLQSILAQNFRNIKYKIFDNASTDGARDIVLKYKAQAELNLNEQNIGAEANFTKCLESMEGEYGAIFHSDDLYEPNILEKAVELLNLNQSASAVFFHALEINEADQVKGVRFLPPELKKHEVNILNKYQFKNLIFKYGNFVTCPGVVARSNLYKNEIKHWDGKQYKSSADLDVWIRLAELGDIIFVSRPYLKYRISEASYTVRHVKKRTTKHDLFLVLDNISPSAEQKIYYDFLTFKDEALRNWNAFLTSSPSINFTYSPFKFLPLIVNSKFHFKFWSLSTGIYLLNYFLRLNVAKKFLRYVLDLGK